MLFHFWTFSSNFWTFRTHKGWWITVRTTCITAFALICVVWDDSVHFSLNATRISSHSALGLEPQHLPDLLARVRFQGMMLHPAILEKCHDITVDGLKVWSSDFPSSIECWQGLQSINKCLIHLSDICYKMWSFLFFDTWGDIVWLLEPASVVSRVNSSKWLVVVILGILLFTLPALVVMGEWMKSSSSARCRCLYDSLEDDSLTSVTFIASGLSWTTQGSLMDGVKVDFAQFLIFCQPFDWTVGVKGLKTVANSSYQIILFIPEDP